MKMPIVSLLLYLLTAVSLQAQNSFPASSVGIWEGMMYSYKHGTKRDSVLVRLNVAATDTDGVWKWKTEYLSEKFPVVKDYLLRLTDSSKNWYITDEGGGVELYEYLFGNKLYSVFETKGIILASSYERRDDELIFEVTSGKKSVSENNPVINYTVENLQRVVFKKIK